MASNDLMNKIRQWDNRAAQWMGRHFHVLLFQLILLCVFILAFMNVLKLINISFNVPNKNIADQLLLNQSINTTLTVMLLLLIALGVLNIINSNARLRNVLKNIEYNLSKRRNDHKPQED